MELRNNANQRENRTIAGKLIPAIVCFVVLVGVDQITKYFITNNMALYSSIPIIPDVLEIHYIQNRGAVWGILQGRQIIFYIFTGFAMILGCWFYMRCSKVQKFRAMRALDVLIMAGGMGNFIDRIRFQYVIDFIYFKLIDFPVFNIADCYVTIGLFCLSYLLIFKYKEEELEAIFSRRAASGDNAPGNE